MPPKKSAKKAATTKGKTTTSKTVVIDLATTKASKYVEGLLKKIKQKKTKDLKEWNATLEDIECGYDPKIDTSSLCFIFDTLKEINALDDVVSFYLSDCREVIEDYLDDTLVDNKNFAQNDTLPEFDLLAPYIICRLLQSTEVDDVSIKDAKSKADFVKKLKSQEILNEIIKNNPPKDYKNMKEVKVTKKDKTDHDHWTDKFAYHMKIFFETCDKNNINDLMTLEARTGLSISNRNENLFMDLNEQCIESLQEMFNLSVFDEILGDDEDYKDDFWRFVAVQYLYTTPIKLPAIFHNFCVQIHQSDYDGSIEKIVKFATRYVTKSRCDFGDETAMVHDTMLGVILGIIDDTNIFEKENLEGMI